MTFGEKLKQARQQAGLSQEQLAQRLCVSRSAIAKWETDKGMPDVENLKAISRCLEVSIDHLLAEEEPLTLETITQPIDLSRYKKHGKCWTKQDAAVREAYPNAASIQPLYREKKLSKTEHILEWTIMPLGIFDFAHQIDTPGAFYLVEDRNRHILVRVTKEAITSTQLPRKITEKKFTVGMDKFTIMNRQIVEE